MSFVYYYRSMFDEYRRFTVLLWAAFDGTPTRMKLSWKLSDIHDLTPTTVYQVAFRPKPRRTQSKERSNFTDEV